MTGACGGKGDRDHGQGVRRSLYRTPGIAEWLEWTHLRQAWLVRTERFSGEKPVLETLAQEVEDRYFLTNLLWNRLQGEGILALVLAHGRLENQDFRTVDMDWEEDDGRPWCRQGLAVDVGGICGGAVSASNASQFRRGGGAGLRGGEGYLAGSPGDAPWLISPVQIPGFQTGEVSKHESGIWAGPLTEGVLWC